MPATVLDQTANGRELSLAIGDRFEVRLDETPTTGFRWRIVSAGTPVCELVGDRFEPPADPVPGRAGSHAWRFHVVAAGRATVELESVRTFQKSANAPSRFRLSVVAG